MNRPRQVVSAARLLIRRFPPGYLPLNFRNSPVKRVTSCWPSSLVYVVPSFRSSIKMPSIINVPG
nr:MAG TPA: hypothetical protein [Caudoviricetes sp.]